MATVQIILATTGDPTSFQIATGVIISVTCWWPHLLADGSRVFRKIKCGSILSDCAWRIEMLTRASIGYGYMSILLSEVTSFNSVYIFIINVPNNKDAVGWLKSQWHRTTSYDFMFARLDVIVTHQSEAKPIVLWFLIITWLLTCLASRKHIVMSWRLNSSLELNGEYHHCYLVTTQHVHPLFDRHVMTRYWSLYLIINRITNHRCNWYRNNYGRKLTWLK